MLSSIPTTSMANTENSSHVPGTILSVLWIWLHSALKGIIRWIPWASFYRWENWRHRQIVSPVWGHGWWPRPRLLVSCCPDPASQISPWNPGNHKEQIGRGQGKLEISRAGWMGLGHHVNEMVWSHQDELRIFLLPWTLPGWGQKKKSWVRKLA